MNKNSFEKECPDCSEIIVYKSRTSLKYSLEKNVVCRSCKDKKQPLFRTCTQCSSNITYASKRARNTAEKKKRLCKSCGIKNGLNNDATKKKKSENMKGENNPMFGKLKEQCPFYGKKHSRETKEILRNQRLGKKIHTEQSKEKISKYQKSNAPMRGRSVFSVWVEKYGLDVAKQKMDDLKAKQRANSLGCKNPMFGKPSPEGSGNGYSGWYDGVYFRSLRELMFLIYAKRFNLNLISLETKKYGIPYVSYDQTNRTYFSDYIVNNRYFVEIKPKKLWATPLNLIKFEAAKRFCEEQNLKFKVIDPRINSKLIKVLYEKGEIVFLEKYKTKIDKFLN